MGPLSMFAGSLSGSPLGSILGIHPQTPGLVTPPAMGGFNAPGFHTFGNMQTGQMPTPTLAHEHPGGIMGFVQQQFGGGGHTPAPPLQTPDMSHPDAPQAMQFGTSGNPMPGQSLRPISGLQQMSGW